MHRTPRPHLALPLLRCRTRKAVPSGSQSPSSRPPMPRSCSTRLKKPGRNHRLYPGLGSGHPHELRICAGLHAITLISRMAKALCDF
ncbi:hypothetical protein B0H12DRAFT_129766 [Mycena haematopus]|nr:hypothetical protein B0H12DRAFT_129766 [Mycena haematopus]